MTKRGRLLRMFVVIAGVALVAVLVNFFVWPSLNTPSPLLPETGVGDADEIAADLVGQVDAADTAYFTAGSLNNAPNAIGFNGSSGMTVDETHHRLYVADGGNSRVLVYNLDSGNRLADRIADFVLGQPDFKSNATATDQNSLAGPAYLVYDETTNLLYVSDVFNERIMVFDVSTIQNAEDALYVIGAPDFITLDQFTPANASNIGSPRGLAIDMTGSRLFAVDGSAFQNRVLVYDISPENLVSQASGTGVAMNAINVLGSASFGYTVGATYDVAVPFPNGIAFEASTNHLFVTSEYHRVSVFDVAEISNGESAIHVLGQDNFTDFIPGTSSTSMFTPLDVVVDSDTHTLYVTDAGNNRVLLYDLTLLTDGQSASHVLGQSLFTTADSAMSQDKLTTPYGLGLSISGGQLYVGDVFGNRILVFDIPVVSDGVNATDLLGQLDEDNQPIFTVGLPDNGPNPQGFNTVSAIELDPIHHRLFTAEADNNRIMVFNLDANDQLIDHTADFVLGQPDFKSFSPGLSATTLTAPAGLAYDTVNDRLFVSDTGNYRILVYDTAAIVNGESASVVLNQPDFDSAVPDEGDSPPGHLAYDSVQQRLFAINGGTIYVYDSNPFIMANGDWGIGLGNQSEFSIESVSFSNFSARGLAYDSEGNRLFATSDTVVGDHFHTVVLVYDVASIEVDETPVNYLGNFNRPVIPNNSGLSDQGGAEGSAYDSVGNRLYVSDRANNRVMVWDVAEITNGEDAVDVIGQADFESAVQATSQTGFSSPADLAIGSPLYVADYNNNRVIAFEVGTVPLTPPPTTEEPPSGGRPRVQAFRPRSIIVDDVAGEPVGALFSDSNIVDVTVRADVSNTFERSGDQVNVVLSNEPSFATSRVFPEDSHLQGVRVTNDNGSIEWKRTFPGWDLCYGISNCNLPGRHDVYARFYVGIGAPAGVSESDSQGQSSACKPRPACLDASPVCDISVPQGGWCTQTSSVRDIIDILRRVNAALANMLNLLK